MLAGARPQRGGVDPSEPESLKDSDPSKLALTDMLWKRPTVPQERIATKLAVYNAARDSH